MRPLRQLQPQRSGLRRCALVAWCIPVLLGFVGPLLAQRPSRLSGSVVDGASNRRLPDATIEVAADSVRRMVRTDDRGEFAISLPSGLYQITTRRVGYQVGVTTIHLTGADSSVVIMLARSAVTLPEVEISGRGPGLHGAVARYQDLAPIAGAHLEILGSGKSIDTDSTGRYAISLPKAGNYVVRASRAGYADQMITVQVPDTAVETVVFLETGTAASIPVSRLEEFDERLRWQAHGAAFVTGTELRRYGGATTAALTAASDVIRRGLHLGADVCLFVNGIARPHVSPDAIPVEWIENVELYTTRGEVTNTLGPEWPSGAPCGGGRTKANGTIGGDSNTGTVRYVVIWLRR